MNRVPFLPVRPFLALALAMAAHGLSGQTLPQLSPFLPAKGTAGPGSDKGAYELGGMITQGKDILVSITRVSDKQSFWIPVGGTENEVTVVSYNTAQDQAIINANGTRLTLGLRQPVVKAGGSGLAVASFTAIGTPAMTTPLPPPPSGSPEIEAREARMFISDMLEIGQEQRKAYEAAKKKADAQKKP